MLASHAAFLQKNSSLSVVCPSYIGGIFGVLQTLLGRNIAHDNSASSSGAALAGYWEVYFSVTGRRFRARPLLLASGMILAWGSLVDAVPDLLDVADFGEQLFILLAAVLNLSPGGRHGGGAPPVTSQLCALRHHVVRSVISAGVTVSVAGGAAAASDSAELRSQAALLAHAGAAFLGMTVNEAVEYGERVGLPVSDLRVVAMNYPADADRPAYIVVGELQSRQALAQKSGVVAPWGGLTVSEIEAVNASSPEDQQAVFKAYMTNACE